MDYKELEEITVDVQTLSILFNVTPRRIQQLAQQGIIERISRGKYSLTNVIIDYIRYLDHFKGLCRDYGIMDSYNPPCRGNVDIDLGDIELDLP